MLTTGWQGQLKDEDYFKIKRLSFHDLKDLQQSSLVYNFRKEHPMESPAMGLGKLVHMALLEPEKYYANRRLFAGDKRGKEYKDLLAWLKTPEAPKDTILISEDNAQTIEGIKKEIMSGPVYGIMSDPTLKTEQVGFFDLYLEECKMKVDMVSDSFIYDIKTTSGLEDVSFGYTAKNYNYITQLVWYAMAAEQIDGKRRQIGIIAIDVDSPHEHRIYDIDAAMIDRELDRIASWFVKYREAKESNFSTKMCQTRKRLWVPSTYWEQYND